MNSKICSYPNCSKPVLHPHQFCGKTHANQFQILKNTHNYFQNTIQNQQKLNIFSGINVHHQQHNQLSQQFNQNQQQFIQNPNSFQQKFNSQLSFQNSTFFKKCIFPGCEKPRFENHEFCGKKHASDYSNLGEYLKSKQNQKLSNGEKITELNESYQKYPEEKFNFELCIKNQQFIFPSDTIIIYGEENDDILFDLSKEFNFIKFYSSDKGIDKNRILGIFLNPGSLQFNKSNDKFMKFDSKKIRVDISNLIIKYSRKIIITNDGPFKPFSIETTDKFRTFKNEEWPSLLHYFYSLKFDDLKVKNQIKKMKTKDELFDFLFSEDVNDEDDDIHLLVKIMLELMKNQRLAFLLTITGNSELLYNSSNLNWGVGKNGKGRNIVGKCLMLVRSLKN